MVMMVTAIIETFCTNYSSLLEKVYEEYNGDRVRQIFSCSFHSCDIGSNKH